MTGRTKTMTKTEAIRNTEYTEKELIDLALMFAITEMKNYRNQASEENDFEAYDHYENLRNAFTAIYEERISK